MRLAELWVIALGLGMDAFAVSVCKGLSVQKATWRQGAWVGLWFGGFQALMPSIGYVLGHGFARLIQAVDHWIAFALLGMIGSIMIRESQQGGQQADDRLSIRAMLPLAVATSIDALATGITFAVLPGVDVRQAAAMIGAVTFGLSAIGFRCGQALGSRYAGRAELFGGCVLVFIGLRILWTHLRG